MISYVCHLLVSLTDANFKDIDCAHHRITMTTYTQCYHRNIPCSRYYTFDQQISAIFSFHHTVHYTCISVAIMQRLVILNVKFVVPYSMLFVLL